MKCKLNATTPTENAMPRYKRFLTLASILIVVVVIVANIAVPLKSKKYLYGSASDIPACYTAIVLGAKVNADGRPSDYLQDRLDCAVELYRAGKVRRFLLSGDHGRTTYDEVNNMKLYLEKQGIPTADIFLDHAGFDTYNTMVRAKKIFRVTDAIIVTQAFHLPRAIYIARSKGLKAYGFKADKRVYSGMKALRFREVPARVKAFAEVTLHKRPHFLGTQIPITGDSRLSYDR